MTIHSRTHPQALAAPQNLFARAEQIGQSKSSKARLASRLSVNQERDFGHESRNERVSPRTRRIMADAFRAELSSIHLTHDLEVTLNI